MKKHVISMEDISLFKHIRDKRKFYAVLSMEIYRIQKDKLLNKEQGNGYL